MASRDASFMVMCCTAASAPPALLPVCTRISPMWLTSNTPHPLRTARCSAISPPLAGYSTGMSQPPKFTILAPRRRCTAFSGVLRTTDMGGEVADSIPSARATRMVTRVPQGGQNSRLLRPCKSPCTPRLLATLPSGTVLFGGAHASRAPADCLHAVRQDRGVLRLREVLHHLQRPAQG